MAHELLIHIMGLHDSATEVENLHAGDMDLTDEQAEALEALQAALPIHEIQSALEAFEGTA